MKAFGTLWAMVAVAAACSSAAPSPSPSRRPPANAVVEGLVTGHAHMKITGDVKHTYDWDLLGASADPDTTVITWGRVLDSFDLLAMPDAIVEGEHVSSLDLWIDLRLDSLHVRFLSEGGECSITLTRVDEGLLEGRVRCERLVSETGAKTIGLSGSFTANSPGS
jgi:hypothetical protein